jgi:hypothetical protein
MEKKISFYDVDGKLVRAIMFDMRNYHVMPPVFLDGEAFYTVNQMPFTVLNMELKAPKVNSIAVNDTSVPECMTSDLSRYVRSKIPCHPVNVLDYTGEELFYISRLIEESRHNTYCKTWLSRILPHLAGLYRAKKLDHKAWAVLRRSFGHEFTNQLKYFSHIA